MNVVGSPPGTPIEASTKKKCEQFFTTSSINWGHYFKSVSWSILNHRKTAIMSHFELISLSDLEEIIRRLSSSTCQLEISERHSADSWTWIISASLTSPCLHAPTQQVLKIAPSWEKNFRPKFSNFKYLLFLWKILEKCVSSQIIIDTQISTGFHAHHSIETALIKDSEH